MKVNAENLGKLLVEFRKKNDLSRQQVADMASNEGMQIDQTTIRNIETGGSNITMRVLLAIEKAIGQESFFKPIQKSTTQESK